MANVKFVLNLPGLNEVMKSSAMQALSNSAANAIAASAGSGYEVESAHNIGFIAISSVRASTYAAKKDCNKNNTLLKAAGSVRI